MKISLTLRPRRRLDRPTAWACLIANLALPGSGSLVAGRRTGYVQAALAVAGMVLSTAFAGWFLREVLRDQGFPEEFGPWLWIGGAGLVCFAGGFCWALVTSLVILSEATSDQPRR